MSDNEEETITTLTAYREVMFNLIKKALGIKDTTDNIESDTGDEIKIDIAACVVLLEVAESDSECTEDEIGHVLETMQSTFREN